MVKITKRSVEAAARTGKEYFLWDDELRGFGLRVHPSGRKIYLAQFRAGGRIRRVNIGPHGPITPDQARTEAMKHLADVRLGSDPGAQRDRLRAAATIKEFGKRFLDEHVASHCKPSTQYEYRRCVDLFITPKLGTLKIIDVTRADVVELHQGLKETPYQANRVLGVLSIMFTLADTWGVRTDGINPCWKVKRYREVKRERYLTDIQKPWRRIRARAGLDTLRIHDLRHSFASDALQLGADLTMIGRLLGHAQVQTTARYAHLKTESVRKTADLISTNIFTSLGNAKF